MTIHIVVSVRDAAVNAYGRPFFTPTPGAAMRGFMDEANQKESPIYSHPEDYELFQLGTFDDETGKFQNQEPKSLATGKMMKNQ